MTATPSPSGPSRASSRRGSGRFRFVLFMLLLIFGGGFYTGLYATKRVTANGPAWMQRLFGVTPLPPALPAAPLANAPKPTVPPTAPAPAPVANSAQSPAPPVNTPTAPKAAGTAAASPGAVTQTQSPTKPDEASPSADTAETPPDLTAAVQDYNAMLRRIQDLAHSYDGIHKKAADPSTPPQALPTLVEEQTTLSDELTAAAQRAQSLQLAIKTDPQFPTFYQETKPCLTPERVPAKLLDMNLDKLLFLQPR